MKQANRAFGGHWILLILALVTVGLILSAKLSTHLSPDDLPVDEGDSEGAPEAPSDPDDRLPREGRPEPSGSWPECGWFLVALEGCDDALAALDRFEAFFSGYRGDDAELVAVVRRVHAIVGRELTGLAEAVRDSRGRFAALADALDRSSAVALREELDRLYTRLDGICGKLLDTSCPLLRQSCWYAFARDCRTLGALGQGADASFQETYALQRIEVMLDYSPQPDAAMREDGFPVNFRQVSFAVFGLYLDSDAETGLRKLPLAECTSLDASANRKWRTVWTGERELHGTPWRPAAIVFSACDENRFTENIEREIAIPLAGGCGLTAETADAVQEWIRIVEMHTDRNTGDPDPKVHVMLAVRPSGADFLSLLPSSPDFP